MSRPLPRVLDVASWSWLGVTEARARTELRRGNWQRLARGVLLTRPDEPTREDWAEVGIALGGPGAALTGYDAVRLHGVGERLSPPPVVTVLSRSGRHRRVGGVRLRPTARPYGWRRQPTDAPWEFMPIVSAARAVADTALDCRSDLAIRGLVTSAVTRRRCTPEELLAEYRHGPRNGSHGFRLGLDDVLGNLRSVAEARAVAALASGPIAPFEPNVPVVDRNGCVLRTVDVLWRELRAAVEIDSRRYHADLEDFEGTQDRHNQLTTYSLSVLHYSPRVVIDERARFVAEVARWLRGRSADLGVAWPPGRGPRRAGPNGPAPFVVECELDSR